MYQIVLLDKPTSQVTEALSGRAEAHIVDPDRNNLAQLLEIAEGIFVRLTPVTDDVLAKAPKLRVIGRHGAGFDTVDIAAATRRKIPVVFTPNANSDAVAEHTVMLMMSAARRLIDLDETIHRGEYRREPYLAGTELHGKTVGIIGFGNIGRKVGQLCSQGFGMRVIVYDPFVPIGQLPDHITHVEKMEELLCKVDFLTLHMPLSDETYHLIDSERLSQIKENAILGNAARGGLVDEHALAQALDRGHLAGAGLDVYEEEPLQADNPLLKVDRHKIVMTPHCAGLTDRAMQRMADMVCSGIFAVLDGEHPSNVVNPQVWSG